MEAIVLPIVKDLDKYLGCYPRKTPFRDEDLPAWMWHMGGYFVNLLFSVGVAAVLDHVESRARPPRRQQPPQLTPRM